jgi:hypothetical protein
MGEWEAAQIKASPTFILSETRPVDKPPRPYYNEVQTNRGSVRAVFAAFKGGKGRRAAFFKRTKVRRC